MRTNTHYHEIGSTQDLTRFCEALATVYGGQNYEFSEVRGTFDNASGEIVFADSGVDVIGMVEDENSGEECLCLSIDGTNENVPIRLLQGCFVSFNGHQF